MSMLIAEDHYKERFCTVFTQAAADSCESSIGVNQLHNKQILASKARKSSLHDQHRVLLGKTINNLIICYGTVLINIFDRITFGW